MPTITDEIPSAGDGTVSIALDEPDASLDSWDVEVRALIEGVSVFVGALVTTPPGGVAGRGKRLLAFARVPGATAYYVSATSVSVLATTLKLAQCKSNVKFDGAFSVVSGGGALGGNQPQVLLWVATNGSDVTGQRGRIDLPFASPQAALNAAQDDDCVIITDGEYLGQTVVPPTLNRVTIKGTSRDTCKLINEVGNALVWEPTDPGLILYLESLSFFSTAAIDGALLAQQPAGVNSCELYVKDCYFEAGNGPDATIRRLGNVYMQECGTPIPAIAEGILIDDMNFAECDNMTGYLTVDVTNPTPAEVTHLQYLVRASNLTVLSNRGLSQLVVDPGGYLDTFDFSTMEFSLLTDGSFSVSGKVGLALGVMTTAPQGLGDTPLRFLNARIQGIIVDNQTIDAIEIDARGSYVQEATLSSAGGGNVELDVRGGYIGIGGGSSFGPDTYVNDDGGAYGDTVGAGGQIYVFGVDVNHPPYPGSAGLSFNATLRQLLTSVDEYPAILASSNLDFQIANDSLVATNVWYTWTNQNV